MKRSEIIDYLNCVVEIEKNIYTLQLSLNELNMKKKNLGIEGYYQEPIKPAKPSLRKKKNAWPLLVLGIASLILSIVVFFMDSFLSLFLSFFIFLVELGFFISYINILRDNKEIQKFNDNLLDLYDKNLASYNKELSAYQKNKQKDKERINKERLEIEIINNFSSKLTIQLNDSNRRLKELYKYDIIHPKYRNLVAVCSFLDYFSAGLCYTFKAPKNSVGGAYYLFENEMLHKRIIYELQKVNENLNQIKISQYSLFCAISESNKALSILNSSMEKIACEQEKGNKNTEKLIEETQISNYYAKQTQKELSYFNNMQYFSGNYDSVNPMFRTPPT